MYGPYSGAVGTGCYRCGPAVSEYCIREVFKLAHRNLEHRADGTVDDDTGELRWRDRRHHAPGNYDTTGMKYVSYFVLALLIGAAAIYGIRNGVSLPLG